MADFELMRYIPIGQYLQTESPLHKMDPRAKLICVVLWLAAISALPSLPSQVFLTLCLIALFPLGRVPIRYGLSGVRSAIPVLIIALPLTVLFYQPPLGSHGVLWRYGVLAISVAGIQLAVLSLLRFLEIVWLVSILTLSTTLSDLTHGLEQLCSPLRRIGVPTRELVLTVTIALRFVPTFALEAEKIMKAQSARGAGFATAKPWQIVRRTRTALPILVPLFLVALHRAEELAMAMEARGYVPGRPRSSYVVHEAARVDVLKVLICLCVVGAAYAIGVIHL